LQALEILEGYPGKNAIEASGIEACGDPFIPEHLTEDARGCIEIIRQSMPVGVYSALDSFLLAQYGMAWAMHKKAALKVAAHDFEPVIQINDNKTAAQNPWLRILNEQALILAKLGDRLGLDPKSRAAIKLPGARQKRSRFDGLLGQTVLLPSSSSLRSLPAKARADDSD
jgi:phage terminase small subunit